MAIRTKLNPVHVPDFIAVMNFIGIIRSQTKVRRRAGKYYGMCPFCLADDQTLVFNPKTQLFYCMVCDTTGDVITWLFTDKFGDYTAEEITAIKLALAVELPHPLIHEELVKKSVLTRILKQESY